MKYFFQNLDSLLIEVITISKKFKIIIILFICHAVYNLKLFVEYVDGIKSFSLLKKIVACLMFRSWFSEKVLTYKSYVLQLCSNFIEMKGCTVIYSLGNLIFRSAHRAYISVQQNSLMQSFHVLDIGAPLSYVQTIIAPWPPILLLLWKYFCDSYETFNFWQPLSIIVCGIQT